MTITKGFPSVFQLGMSTSSDSSEFDDDVTSLLTIIAASVAAFVTVCVSR